VGILNTVGVAIPGHVGATVSMVRAVFRGVEAGAVVKAVS
jgi:hypothetical protein